MTNRNLSFWTTLVMIVFAAAAVVIIVAGTSQAETATTVAADPTATEVSTAEPTAEVTAEPTATATAMPTAEPSATPTPLPTATEAEGLVLESTEAPPGAVISVADASGIDAGALYHDTRSTLYRTPTGAAPFNSTVTLRLRAAAGNLDEARVRVYMTREQREFFLPMRVIATTPDGYDFWESQLEVGPRGTVYWYRFIVTRGATTMYYEDDTKPDGSTYLFAREGGRGTVYASSPDLSFQINVYNPDFYTPAWMRSATIYQIFPDRFRDGDPSNNPTDGSEIFYGSIPLYFHETWNAPMLDGRVDKLPDGSGYWNSDFYGGDLAGIIEKLDYLQELGVTALYLNPIFLARSNHRYDTADFLQIDPMLGTLEDFQKLVAEADQRGMKLILDGVFNHLSSDSYFFDRYERFEDVGACESLDSPYRDWFYFVPARANQPAPCAGDPDPLYYVSWFGFDSIPKINSTVSSVIRYFFNSPESVAQTWGREGIGGWRLDVAGDIDDGRDPANLYWESFRRVVRRVNPETVIIGEEWADAAEWLQGDEWDSTMNYRLRLGVLGFARETTFVDNDNNGDRSIFPLAPSAFDGLVRSIEEDYPRPAYHALMNLLGSHDTNRLLYVMGNDKQRHQLAALTVFTLPGAPTIYYGDEIALDAPSRDTSGTPQDDPYNRAPYPWPDTEGDFYPPPDETMLTFYQTLGQMRQQTPALREGDMLTLLTDDTAGVYAFLRLDRAAGSAALVALNNSRSDQTVTVNFGGLLPTGLTLDATFGAAAVSTDAGAAEITIPALSGEVWAFTGDAAAFALPAAPEGVQTVSESRKVTVNWDAVDGAAGYLVYRSYVAEGGFEPLFTTPITDTVFVDESVTNGFFVYYAIATVSEAGVVGDLSASALGVPSEPISAAYYVGSDLAERTVERVFGLAVELQAAVEVTGATGGETPAKGVRAEAALIPAEADLADARWQPMAYVGAADGADVYGFTFKPEAINTFVTVARFSIDAGQSWTLVTLDDGAYPRLVVTRAADTTPPPAPESARIAKASLTAVALEWTPVAADDLLAYRIYRTDSAGTTALIAEVADPAAASYEDTAVVEGETYTYAVSGVDAALNESEPTATEAVKIERRLTAVTFTVTVPAATNSDVYIAGSFGMRDYPIWDPAGLKMTPGDGDTWTITLNIVEGAKIEYKYVRGDWSAVEKGAACEEIANRVVIIAPDDDGSMAVADTVAKWRDLDACP